ncbi:hypothetical protein [Ileibacterium valens]|uniref:hypothetical protein n=1 Tax=Ileibacterium valens TaxID=1862668 RepID=UPI002356A2A5|nr:hypothetical protein [Ileibacterium valens]
MKNEELIKRLAQPILDKLLAQEEIFYDDFAQTPTIHLVLDDSCKTGNPYFDEELIHDLEKYVQEQIELWFHPKVLH